MPKRNSPTSKPRKASFRLFALGFAAFAALSAFGASLIMGSSAVRADADDSWTPGEETLVPREQLSVTASSSALTDDSQSVTVTFTSKKIEAYPNSSQVKNVYVTPIDPAFDIKTATDQAKEAREEQGEEFVMPVYECSVFNVCYNPNGGSMKTTVVIPDQLIYSNLIVFKVTTIGSGVVFNDEGDIDYGEIEKIVIPQTVTSIEAKAFVEVPEDVQIVCEAHETYTNEQGEVLRTYPEEWTEAPVTYDYKLTASETALLNRAAGGKKEFGEGDDFFLGIDSEEYQLPLYVQYQLEKVGEDGEYHPLLGYHYQALPIQSTNNDFDAVGSRMGVASITTYVNVSVPTGHRILSSSLCFHNIYHAIPDPNQVGRYIPDLETGALYSYPLVTYNFVPHFSDFFDMEQVSFTTLGSFLQFEVKFTRVPWTTGYGVYSTLQPTIFNANEALIRNGTLQVRYQFSALDQASYRFTMNDGTQIVARIKTPIPYIHIPEGGYNVGFLIDIAGIEGLSYGNLHSVELLGFSVKSDLYKPSTNSIVTKSAFTVRFGSLVLFGDVAGTKHIELPLVIGLTYLFYVIGFAAIAAAYYFYAKKRFRNDEFRRVNDRRFLINSVKNFLGFGFVLSAILFIVCRWALMRTTLVTYNPLDAFVAAFSVIALVFLGFTIKNLVVSIKNARKRKEALRLKLDQDVDDDGTK